MQHTRAFPLLSVLAAALFPVHAFATETLQTFDQAAPGLIQPGERLRVDGITVSTQDGTTAAIKAVKDPDELASGIAVGAVDDGSTASLKLFFTRPQPSVAFTLVLPASAAPYTALASVLNAREERRQIVAIDHRAMEQRVRVRLHGDDGARIENVALTLGHGAYVDNVTMDTAEAGDGYVIDPALLPQGAMSGHGETDDAIVTPTANLFVGREPTSGTPMLGSRLATGNDVSFVFKGRRDAIEVTLAAPATSDADLEFSASDVAGGGHIYPIHTTHVRRGDTRACFKAPLGTELQALRWTGGNLAIRKIELRSTPAGSCEGQ